MVRARALVGSRASRWCCATLAAATGWAAPSAASAPRTCPVRIASGGDEWIIAGRDLERQLGSMPGRAHCASIEVDVDRLGHLILVNSDGQRAERDLGQPFELGPTVQALLVDLDWSADGDSHPPASSSPQGEGVTSPMRAMSDRERVVPGAQVEPAPNKEVSSIVLGAALGARYGASIATPTVHAFGALRLRRWELGVLGDWEVSYKSLTEGGPAWSGAGLVSGISVARREPASSSLDYLVGAIVSVAVLHQETRERHPEIEATNAEGRMGGFVGLVGPTRAAWRVRLQLRADATAVGPTQRTIVADVPPLPAWAIGAQLGVEGDAL